MHSWITCAMLYNRQNCPFWVSQQFSTSETWLEIGWFMNVWMFNLELILYFMLNLKKVTRMSCQGISSNLPNLAASKPWESAARLWGSDHLISVGRGGGCILPQNQTLFYDFCVNKFFWYCRNKLFLYKAYFFFLWRKQKQTFFFCEKSKTIFFSLKKTSPPPCKNQMAAP